MPKGKRKSTDSTANLGFEAKLWAAADALRNNMDAAEYKHDGAGAGGVAFLDLGGVSVTCE